MENKAEAIDMDLSSSKSRLGMTAVQGNLPLIFVGVDSAELDHICTQLKFVGYSIIVANNADNPALYESENPPLAILTSYKYIKKNGRTLIHILCELCKKYKKNALACLMFDGPETLDDRLFALRTGVTAYYNDSMSLSLLISALNSLQSISDNDMYRALLVVNDQRLLNNLKNILEDGGIVTHLLENSMDILDALPRYNPDFLILSPCFEKCTGIELVAAIKQKEENFCLSVAFVGKAEDVSTILPAVSSMSGSIITETMRSTDVLSICMTLARQSRIMRNLVAMDSLTGLLNHVNGKFSLQQEIARAERDNTSFAFAMLDLDHFKYVNDTYGHIAGDAVLKALATLLRQRLRRSDIITRYGGEEFSIIMLGARDIDSAMQVMDVIREYFSNFQHHHEGNVFTVSFSCGIAMYPDFKSITELTSAADRALYAAKHTGRNRVAVADPQDDLLD